MGQLIKEISACYVTNGPTKGVNASGQRNRFEYKRLMGTLVQRYANGCRRSE